MNWNRLKEWAAKNPHYGHAVGLFLLLLAVQYPAIFNSQFFVDDKLILVPLLKVRSIPDFFGAPTPDLQYVRDFFLWVGLQIDVATPFPFRLMSLAFFVLTALVCAKIYARQSGKQVPFLAIAVIAAHPAFGISLGWVSAIKHVLACLLITLSLWYFIKGQQGKRRYLALSALFYVLSLLSNPITIHFPLIFPFLAPKEFKLGPKNLFYYSCIFVLASLIAFGNYAHIMSLPPRAGYELGGVYQNLSQKAWGGVQTLGRYAYNFVLPYRLYTWYGPDSPQQHVGALFLALFAFRLRHHKKYLLWMLLSFCLVMFPIAYLHRFYPSDTYAIGTYLSLGFLAHSLMQDHLQERTRAVVQCAILALYCGLSMGKAREMGDNYLYLTNNSWLEKSAEAKSTLENSAHYGLEELEEMVASYHQDAPEEVLERYVGKLTATQTDWEVTEKKVASIRNKHMVPVHLFYHDYYCSKKDVPKAKESLSKILEEVDKGNSLFMRTYVIWGLEHPCAIPPRNTDKLKRMGMWVRQAFFRTSAR